MALTPTCDRCGAQNVQIVPVLGVEACNVCVEETRQFLATPPARAGLTKSEQALRVAAVRGRVTDAELALANQEPRRRVYYRLIAMVKQGRLVHRGRGVFELPREAV